MKRAKLIVASSESSADILYATGFHAPDAFVYVQSESGKALLLSDLEVDRGRKEAKVDVVVAYSDLAKEVQGSKKSAPSYAKVVADFLRRRGAERVSVPRDFPLGLARELKDEDIRLKPAEGIFLPERTIKSPKEIKLIEAALRVAEAGLERAHEVLRATKIRKDRKLGWNGKVLTSEILRTEMELAVVRAGGVAKGDTIVAGGKQGCDPHERGRGALRADELIILDIFPRHAKSGFYGDITRTVLRGTASDAQRKIWETCLSGQTQALAAIKPGVEGIEIHNAIKALFTEGGYATEIHEGRWRGFFHGTGHGLGLDLHEEPRFGATTFAPGQVFTVEPGIYWPGVGAVRHEDVVVITEEGNRVLTSYPKTLEL